MSGGETRWDSDFYHLLLKQVNLVLRLKKVLYELDLSSIKGVTLTFYKAYEMYVKSGAIGRRCLILLLHLVVNILQRRLLVH